jgi:hypothetical protein
MTYDSLFVIAYYSSLIRRIISIVKPMDLSNVWNMIIPGRFCSVHRYISKYTCKNKNEIVSFRFKSEIDMHIKHNACIYNYLQRKVAFSVNVYLPKRLCS